ncbi:MAG: hypothetical protein JST89_11330 [Cyanobacteria bacterium SZAS-4]|nr:hypothetical protein [Cyanobacteria bacterium SZAS-4]
MGVEHAEATSFDSGSSRISDGGDGARWNEISVQNTPGGVTSSRESSAFAAGVGGTPDATIGKDFISFSGTKDGAVFAQASVPGETVYSGDDGQKFSVQRSDGPDGSGKVSISDFTHITDIDIGPNGRLRGIETLRSDGRPSTLESGDELRDKFVPNMGPDGKPDGTSSYTTPEGVRIDMDNCGAVTNVSRKGTTVYSRDKSQCTS